MADVALRLLGDFEVIRGGVGVDLPPSRKTRGLLAYLALNPRPMRREHLCELLWEIPDDPRGSLRWSLSRIRKLVDGAGRARVVADRNTVALDTSDVEIDVRALHALAGSALERAADEELVRAATALGGDFLEGLDLPDFHDFYTWCIGERERVSRSQAAILRALLNRLGGRPDQALDYANRLVTLLPFDEPARGALIELLLRLDRRQEAQQQYRIGLQKLREAGGAESALLHRALHGTPRVRGEPPPRARATAAAAPLTGAAAFTGDRALVGREREMALIGRLMRQLVEEGGARVLLLRGEAGMGKSRLLQAAAALAREAGAGILRATAFESEQVRPFAPWSDALRRALPGNPASALLGSGERVSRDQVFVSLSEVMQGATAERPMAVLFDDVQWCDESSVSAMHYVLRMNRRLPLLVVAAARDGELRDNAPVQQCIRDLRRDDLLQELRLDPMPAAELHELIRRHTPQADAAGISAACGGNPLLALELARAQQEGAGAGSLAELVRERMSRLGGEAAEVLIWAAVLAPRIDAGALEKVTGLARVAVDDAIEAAERQGMLLPGERGFRFSHDLIARSVYDEIAPARQRAMHRRAAELLEADAALELGLAADLAHHAARSGDPALAARSMVSAGRLCLRFYANRDAVALYQRGLAFARQLGDAQRVCLTLELCDIRQQAAPLEDWTAAVAEYIELAEQALDHGAMAHARLGYQMASYLRWAHDKVADAQRDSLQAERVSRAADDEAHILGMAEAAKCLALLERDLSRADAMAMEAAALAARHQVQCQALPTALGILRYYEGRLDDAAEYLEEARTLSKSRGDRLGEFMANEYLTMIEVERDDYDAALPRSAALVQIGERLREGSEHPFALALQALCRYGVRGQDAGLEEALAVLRRVDAKQRLAFLLNRAAMLDIRCGRPEAARRRAGEALDLAQLMDRPSEALQAHISLASVGGGELWVESRDHMVAIGELLGGTVASWVRERAAPLLAGREGVTTT